MVLWGMATALPISKISGGSTFAPELSDVNKPLGVRGAEFGDIIDTHSKALLG
jgi:hypothetical protein